MSVPNIPMKGYHGDGDSNIELHHSEPEYWSTKYTIVSLLLISITLIAGCLLIAKL